ncbi:C1 family peptidase [Methanosarcina acetivorans]|uniref:Cysteine protease (Papain C1 family) n=1 Tax=Methanosarcina acetivorans (strain ATCC 35395 / DSM 2834 / JCM 12185 / C2A) TaxID=188937 RepID=Q8TL25_METAC|nr:C1 family peptidase [Methanosarcina acetivorans]AAM06588.1 cysteine protease (papain C1 family) [Methanosarcina acetivorans C2A]
MIGIVAAFEKVKIPEMGKSFGTGWLPPLPSLKDYTEESAQIPEMAEKLGIPTSRKETKTLELPVSIDFRNWCSPIEDQMDLGSCTAHAGVGVVEYFERRAFGKHIDGSRFFVYKTTRNLMGVKGDTGAWLRNTMGALALCGVPPEKYFPYTSRKTPGPDGEPTFDDEPSSFVYSLADNFEALNYFCHDPQGMNLPPEDVILSVKKYLAAGIPSMFGFYGFPSFKDTDVKGGIPFPGPDERSIWGHAVVAVGYDDNMKIRNTLSNKETTGAFLIRNSWGTAWGDKGYGWLPYEYALNKFALDFWSLISMKWVETGNFGLELESSRSRARETLSRDMPLPHA